MNAEGVALVLVVVVVVAVIVCRARVWVVNRGANEGDRPAAVGLGASSECVAVALTLQQREFAVAAIHFVNQTDAGLARRFTVDGSTLRVPRDREVIAAFAHLGLWKVEYVIDDFKAMGDLTQPERAQYYRSLRSLENKIYAAIVDVAM